MLSNYKRIKEFPACSEMATCRDPMQEVPRFTFKTCSEIG